ncbi:unnamed protein product [Cylindrotheca closterium]|uniref:Zinc finger C2H2 LYAR-type domain-containing protein n=1 Tax=Cylindrotheca closterium TaxID=2856 RepID=A0AAD2FXQ0_9STRA|nr:unnamed protein product [Cylindrotheca closterium]
MVFFCCDGCGETFKKSKVDTHAARCRQCASVSCVDCSVSFFGDDYRAHTSCISEAERYEGKLYKPKKRNPQEEWMDIVETCAQSAPAHLKNYLETMTDLDNIPRKEKQFRNFTMNSLNLRGRGEAIVGEVWNLLKAEREKRTAAKQEQEAKKKHEVELRKKEDGEKNRRETKQTAVADNSDDDSAGDNEDTKKSKGQSKEPPSTSSESVDKKKVKKLMKKALKKAPDRKMKLKSLRKQLETEMGLSKKSKKMLKELLLQVPKSKKSNILIDGKMISME